MKSQLVSALCALCGEDEHPSGAAPLGTPHVRAPREALK